MIKVNVDEVGVKPKRNHMIDMGFGRTHVRSVEFNIAVKALPVLVAVESPLCATNIFPDSRITSDN
jgi:hypothetical protein